MLPAQLCDRRDNPARLPWRHDSSRRLCAPLQAVRPGVPSRDADSPHHPVRRRAAHSHPPATDLRLRARQPRDHARVEPHPLRHARPNPAADDRRRGHLSARGSALHSGPHPDLNPGTGRELHQPGAGNGPRVFRGDRPLLAGMVPLSVGAVRMAAGGDSRGGHLEAFKLRGNRRHHRRADNLDPRSAE